MKLTRAFRVPVIVLSVSVAALLLPAFAPAETGQGDRKTADSAQQLPEVICVYSRQSLVVTAPWPMARVSVTDPDIADVQMLTPRELLLQGKKIGSTDLLMWNADEQVAQSRVDVQADIRKLEQEIGKLLPNSKLEFSQVENTVVVSGMLSRAEHTEYLQNFMSLSGLQYVNMAAVAGVHQVQLKVRMAEVSRTALKMLGINAFMTGNEAFGAVTVGSSDGGAVNPISIGAPNGTLAGTANVPFIFTADTAVSPGITFFGGFPDVGLEYFLQALEENRYLRILAEPNLVALSGHEASFLAGGEYPIPVVQGGAGAIGTSISIEYREFGVQLSFRPVVLGDNTIRLEVAPEVSQLSDVGAVTIEGFQVPSVLTRRASTTLELHSGQTFALAGLLSRATNATSSRVPLMGDLPVLGALFRSVRYQQEDTELLVLVTANLVEPMSLASEPPVPGFAHTPPNDWELYSQGKIEGEGPTRISASQAEWLDQNGLDELRGPGAWVDYNTKPAPSRSDLSLTPIQLELDDGPEASSMTTKDDDVKILTPE